MHKTNMNSHIEHYYWVLENDSAIYSLYVARKKLESHKYFVKSKYDADCDLWRLTSTTPIMPYARLVHQTFLYNQQHTDDTDFTYSIADRKEKESIEKMIKTFANMHDIISPSIDNHTDLWYPRDMLEFIRRTPGR